MFLCILIVILVLLVKMILWMLMLWSFIWESGKMIRDLDLE